MLLILHVLFGVVLFVVYIKIIRKKNRGGYKCKGDTERKPNRLGETVVYLSQKCRFASSLIGCRKAILLPLPVSDVINLSGLNLVVNLVILVIILVIPVIDVVSVINDVLIINIVLIINVINAALIINDILVINVVFGINDFRVQVWDTESLFDFWFILFLNKAQSFDMKLFIAAGLGNLVSGFLFLLLAFGGFRAHVILNSLIGPDRT